MLLLLCASIYAFHTLIKWQSSLSRSTRTHYLFAAGYSLLTVVVWWCVTIRFVGSPPFLLILPGQARYFFIPFKGTSKPNHQQQQQKTKTKTKQKQKREREREKKKWPCINDSKFKRAQQQNINSSSHIQIWLIGYIRGTSIITVLILSAFIPTPIHHITASHTATRTHRYTHPHISVSLSLSLCLCLSVSHRLTHTRAGACAYRHARTQITDQAG